VRQSPHGASDALLGSAREVRARGFGGLVETSNRRRDRRSLDGRWILARSRRSVLNYRR